VRDARTLVLSLRRREDGASLAGHLSRCVSDAIAQAKTIQNLYAWLRDGKCIYGC
jgi:hypothetical protein